MEQTLEQENKEVIENFFRQLNIMSNDRRMAQQVTEHLSREHRTLQQNFFRVIKQVIETYGESQGPAFSDLRNEGSKKWAETVREAGRDIFLPYV